MSRESSTSAVSDTAAAYIIQKDSKNAPLPIIIRSSAVFMPSLCILTHCHNWHKPAWRTAARCLPYTVGMQWKHVGRCWRYLSFVVGVGLRTWQFGKVVFAKWRLLHNNKDLGRLIDFSTGLVDLAKWQS